MEDLKVKEIDVLRAYCSKLNDFKTGTTFAGALIDKQIRNIIDNLASKSNEARTTYSSMKNDAEEVIRRYDYALSQCRNARFYIGETDIECKLKLQEAEIIKEQVDNLMRQLKIELENAGQHTKNFSLQVLNMVDSCQSHMNKIINALENYKSQNI